MLCATPVQEKSLSHSLLGDMEIDPSKKEEQYDYSDNQRPSKRRARGLGSGYIHWRITTVNGKDYQQAYYHWKEDGCKRTKYIPKKLLLVIQLAEASKLPVREILTLLGVEEVKSRLLGDIQVSPSKNQELGVEEVKNRLLGDIQVSPSKNGELAVEEAKSRLLGDIGISPSKNEELGIEEAKNRLLGDIGMSPGKNKEPEEIEVSPSKNRRRKGDGSGNIYWRVVTKKGKKYSQAYYHYELWKQGDRYVKSTKYIPKRLLAQVQELDIQKAPVKEVLRVLGVVR